MPRPRDFAAARYRVTSTRQRVPTDEDLLRTVSRGFPGTPMPAFGHLPKGDLEALVAKLKSFAGNPLDPRQDPASPTDSGPIPVAPEPPDTEEGRARGFALYAKNCAPCHGPTGHGDGAKLQFDDTGMPVWPRNFALGEWKGGGAPRDLYLRIVGGIGGSPMPATDALAGDAAWDVVHWVRAQADPAKDARHDQVRRSIAAARCAGEAPLDPADPRWEKAAESWVALMPLWTKREKRIEGIRVRALHDGTQVALLLRWEDDTQDSSTFGQQEFRDAAAVQLSSLADPPFFGMGAPAGTVRVWMWKADRQADASRAGDLETRFPGFASDGWPVSGGRLPLATDVPLAAHDGLFLTGKAAGNLVSDLSGKQAAESLLARGVGTLRRCPEGPTVESRGAWASGSWSVVLRRALADPDPDGVPFTPGRKVSIAFAAWNGSDQDRNGIKSVTIWHELVLL